MPHIEVEIKSGAYYDSIVLMHLQHSLANQPGVLDVGVVMGTNANKEILAQSNLLVPDATAAGADDLIIAVKTKDKSSAEAALKQAEELLVRRQHRDIDEEYRPKSLESAVEMVPDASWVLVSVPGRYAAGVARDALRLGKNVFLYSDNVSLEDEIALKRIATEKGLLVMGPDCGTAIVNGVGLGFANKVRRGPIGIVAASGTGLQQVSSRIHQLGSGITHAFGTGGRDLSEAVNALTARQGLMLLSEDSNTKVIVLVSKPPSPQVADDLLSAVRTIRKPIVVNFIGYPTATRKVDNTYFSTTFDETAELAVQLTISIPAEETLSRIDSSRFASGQRYLRGLFSGGTLAYEALLILRDYVPAVYSNAPLDKEMLLPDSLVSQQHTIIDLGEDEFTVGRLHPMMDNDLRIRRLESEAGDPEVAVILLDVVLGYGAHPNPAGELAPAIARARDEADKAGRHLEVVAVVTGTDEDPQDMHTQIEQLEKAGALVFTSNDSAVRLVGRLLATLDPRVASLDQHNDVNIDLDTLNQPMVAINVGLESFTESLINQDAQVIQVDWRPPASGNEKLIAILERMKSK